MNRIVSWFSCGAASAVATRLALDANAGNKDFVIGYCEIKEEHPDNKRFLRECEEWFNYPITIMGNDKYNRSIYEVFLKTRFLKGPQGAACTRLLKKQVRQDFERPGDVQVFGFTSEEAPRMERFVTQNPTAEVWPILIERGITKQDCLALIARAGIELPEMYKLGYKNNNCMGCVKGEAGYWNKVRVDFPEMFEAMSDMEEYLGRTVCKQQGTTDGKRWLKRIPLRELPTDLGRYSAEADIDCGVVCEYVDQELSKYEE